MDMRKIFLLAATALWLAGCSPDDGNGVPADELLAGTEWKYGTLSGDDRLYPEDNVGTVVVYDPVSEYFPDVEYTGGEVRKTWERTSDTVWVSDELYGATLSFDGRQCVFHEEYCKDFKVTREVSYAQTLTYVPRKYVSTIGPVLSLEVTSDAIVIYRMDPETGHSSGSVYRPLKDFQYTSVWTENEPADYGTVLLRQHTETFGYQRTDREVVLTGDGKKWVGTIDWDDWTVDFMQIVPEKKEMPTFSLK